MYFTHAGCFRYISGISGHVKSGNYPGKYPEDYECMTIIHSPSIYPLHVQVMQHHGFFCFNNSLCMFGQKDVLLNLRSSYSDLSSPWYRHFSVTNTNTELKFRKWKHRFWELNYCQYWDYDIAWLSSWINTLETITQRVANYQNVITMW